MFTHLTPTDSEQYLREAARVLRPSGRLLATFFLVNDELPDTPERRRRTRYELTDSEGHPYCSSVEQTSERMIAHYEEGVRAMYDRAGLEVERVFRGDWEGGFPGVGQDRIVARRG